jgi:hypothetical protein
VESNPAVLVEKVELAVPTGWPFWLTVNVAG